MIDFPQTKSSMFSAIITSIVQYGESLFGIVCRNIADNLKGILFDVQRYNFAAVIVINYERDTQ